MLEIRIPIGVRLAGGTLGGYLISSRLRRRPHLERGGLAPRAEHLDEALAELIERHEPFDVFHLQILIHICSELERIERRGRRQ